MLFHTTIALFFCIFAVSINGNGFDQCPGVSSDSQEYFKVKYDAAPIVAYGTVTSVKGNIVTLAISCTLKGQLQASVVEVPQFQQVANSTECHYLTPNKEYIVFLESMKTTGSENKLYRLADMEEIEINPSTVKAFLDEECDDEDDFGIEMTIFYYNKNLKCGQFTATCNQATKTQILALNYPPLTADTKFLGGIKKILPVPNMSDSISGKQSGGIADELNQSSATSTKIWTPLIIFLTGLVMKLNF